MIRTTLRVALGLLLVFSLPSPAQQEKELVGYLEDDRYIARDKSFSFKLPIDGSPDALREAINDSLSQGSQVIEVRSTSESSHYRFEISRVPPGDKDTGNFTEATAKTFDWYRRLIQRAWRQPLTEVVSTEFDWNGRRAAHAIFKQFADAQSGPRYHIFYLADFGNTVSFLWTNISLPEEDLETEDTIIAASAGPALRAKQSFLSFRLE